MDRFAVETFLYSADFGDDNYLLDSSSSSESDDDCSCSVPSQNTGFSPLGYMEMVVPELLDTDFECNFRITRKTAEKVAELIGQELFSNYEGELQKLSKSKVAYIFLWYLGSKETFEQISERFKITTACAEAIIKLGAKRVSSKLNDFISWPSSEECSSIAGGYLEVANMEGIIASLGISYIQIPEPKQDHSDYYNLQNNCSLAVQGAVTTNFKFIHLHIGKGGSSHKDMLNSSHIAEKAAEHYSLVCDNNYPLCPWLRPPYLRCSLTPRQVYFNKCHTTALSFLAQTFGYLKKRFVRLQKLDNNDVDFLSMLIRSACVIHNICIDLEDSCDYFLEDRDVVEDR